MYSALVIGCGNIGALYDLNNDKILTHAKALYLDKRFTFSVYDVNRNLARTVSNKYNCEVVKNIDDSLLHSFDCVSICTPTKTHYSFLEAALRAQVKLVICEKPISNNTEELKAIKTKYLKGKSKVLVNYIRRFQPAYLQLKQTIASILKKESITNICIRYQRGFLNNCGHAIDTIEFLTDEVFALKNIKVNNKIFDSFPEDPTASIQASWNKTNVSIAGLSHVKFSYFEIDLFFENHWVAIKNAGANIEIYKAEKDNKRFHPLKIQSPLSHGDCLKDYMKHVIKYAHGLLSAKGNNDNFLGSVGLNMRMLNYSNK